MVSLFESLLPSEALCRSILDQPMDLRQLAPGLSDALRVRVEQCLLRNSPHARASDALLVSRNEECALASPTTTLSGTGIARLMALSCRGPVALVVSITSSCLALQATEIRYC
jgi:hypothetical protein